MRLARPPGGHYSQETLLRANVHGLALRHQDHAGDGEHQHQGQRQKRIDGPVGHAVLQEKQEDRGVQRRALRIGSVTTGNSGADAPEGQ